MTMLEGISATNLKIGRIRVKDEEAEKSIWTHMKGFIIILRCLMSSYRIQRTEM